MIGREPKYLIKFNNAYNDNGTVCVGLTQVNSSKQGKAWSFKGRYSKMRAMHEGCQKTHWKKELPEFPPRRLLFNNTKEQFIQKRRKELENYYITLFSSIDIEEFPQVYAFFNTNKPQDKVVVEPVVDQQPENVVEERKKEKKEKQLKKIFEEIVQSAEKQMVESSDYDHEIDNEAQRKLNHEFQSMRFELKSNLLEGVCLPQGEKENDGQYWSMLFTDQHEAKIDKLIKLQEAVEHILQTQTPAVQFVTVL